MHGWWAASYVVLWILVIMLCVLVVALARQIGTLHLRLGPRGALEIDDEGPALGEAPEPVDATDTNGNQLVVGGPGSAQLLLFVSPGCQVCGQVLPSIGAASALGGMTPIVITDVDPAETKLTFAPKKVPSPVVSGVDIALRYSVPGTPYLVALDELGVVRAKGTVNNLEQMEGLIDTARRRMADALPRMGS